MISLASVTFAGLPGSLRDWSNWLGVSVQSISAYRTGDRSPNSAMRMKLREEVKARYDVEIPEDSWDRRVTPEEAAMMTQRAIPPRPQAAPPGSPAPRATPDDVAEVTADLLRHIRELSLELKDPVSTQGYDLSQRIAMGDKLAGMIDRLGKLTGVRLTERQILASPIFHELLERIMLALAPWPDAIRAAAKALEPVEKDPKA